ncbi:MAG: SH3 domain-containing protein [Clostridia bacterium]|nr:SH3 domain-containing protein [Clostridia bacterium]
MIKKCIAVILALTLALSLWTLAEAEERTGRVFGGWLILRASPSYNGQIRSSYPSGTVVTITGQSGAWYQVKAPDGLTGYMLGSYLKVDGGIVPSGTKAYVISQNGLNVRLRSGPGTGYSTIASYAPGTECTILESGASWSRIRIGSYTGYMMSRYLSGQVVPTPTADPGGEINAWVISRNGHGVNLRSGPGKGYASIGYYSVGTSASILSAGAVWSYIRIGSRHGYMMSEFLTTVAPVVPPVPIPGGAYVVSENGKGVNLRTGPGKQYGVIRVIPAGTPVTIITRGVEWHYVKAGDFFGYMMSQYIYQAIGPHPRPTGKPTPTPTPTATPTATPTPSPTPTPTPKPTTLKKGSKGEEVKQLQNRLKELKYLDLSIPTDGEFGDLTEKAVKAFQKINSITPDGIVGGTTHAVLNSDMAIPKPDGKTLDQILAAEEAIISITLKLGDNNSDVKKMQDRLKVLEYLKSDVTSDGIFGELTEQAVKAFQHINGIEPDGIAGPLTLTKMAGDEAKKKPADKTLDQIIAEIESKKSAPAQTGSKSGETDTANTVDENIQRGENPGNTSGGSGNSGNTGTDSGSGSGNSGTSSGNSGDTGSGSSGTGSGSDASKSGESGNSGTSNGSDTGTGGGNDASNTGESGSNGTGSESDTGTGDGNDASKSGGSGSSGSDGDNSSAGDGSQGGSSGSNGGSETGSGNDGGTTGGGSEGGSSGSNGGGETGSGNDGGATGGGSGDGAGGGNENNGTEGGSAEG